MKNKSLFILLLFFCVFLEWHPECFADFSFVVMGDSRARHGAKEGVNKEMLNRLVDLISADKPAFIVFVGDLVCSSNADSEEELKTYFLNWKDIMDRAGVRVYICVGNEDIDKYGGKAEDIIREVFDMPANGPEGLEELVYSFDFGGAHFVVMDTAVDAEQGLVDAEQVKWLKLDLNENQSDSVFVFGHHPFFPNGVHKGNSLDRYPGIRDELWTLFKNSGVDIYFCGHEHFFHRDLMEGLLQVTTGGAGAPLHSSSEGEGKFYHYCLVTVRDDGSCHIRVKDIEGEARGEWETERR